MTLPRPTSLVAERAVRLLREAISPIDSCTLAAKLLALKSADETATTELLRNTFGEDPRLLYGEGGWRLSGSPSNETAAPTPEEESDDQVDRVLVFVDGERRDPTQPYRLRNTAALRLRGDEVIGACGGDTVEGAYGNRLRQAMLTMR